MLNQGGTSSDSEVFRADASIVVEMRKRPRDADLGTKIRTIHVSISTDMSPTSLSDLSTSASWEGQVHCPIIDIVLLSPHYSTYQSTLKITV
jgi:hypothetical protein